MAENDRKTRTIYCNCSYYDFIPEKTRQKILDAVSESGIEFEAVSDLCLLAAKRDPILQKWSKSESVRIIACFPRAIKWLFDAANAKLAESGVEFFNMRTVSPEDIIEALNLTANGEQTKPKPELQKISEWVPWFPVIDYDRCRNCKQCMNFCLFGTYGLSADNKVEVQNPAHCKTNCPACARVCPHSAIIFPKYGEAPINGDDIPETVNDEENKSKLSEALQGNVYDAIRQRGRGQKRFSPKEESPTSNTPRRSLEDLRRELNIPVEVLSSLSLSELQKIRKKSRETTLQQEKETQENIYDKKEGNLSE